VLLIDGRQYEPSCGLIDPTVVTDLVHATGQAYTVNVIDGVNPGALLAWDAPGRCSPPLEGRWHAMLARPSTPPNTKGVANPRTPGPVGASAVTPGVRGAMDGHGPQRKAKGNS
jgi:hypothetical protein